MKTHRQALPERHLLQEYQVGWVLGAGGFGLTYLGWDTALDKPVAIKEYLPNELAVRESDYSVVPKSSDDEENFTWGLERFIEEARTLAKFEHPAIVSVYRFFQAHNTAYIVMEYAEGETLGALLKRERVISEARLLAILKPLLAGLQEVHAAGFLHRDIKPSNIIIRSNGSPVLVDFGSARQAVGARSRSITSVVTPGYAPLEQYSTRGKQGAWTDIYALGALSYRALTGNTPPDATERVVEDEIKPLAKAAKGKCTATLAHAITQALAVKESNRPRDIASWRAMLESDADAHSANESDLRSVSALDEPAPRPRRVRKKSAAKKSAAWPVVDESEQEAAPTSLKPAFLIFAIAAVIILIGLITSQQSDEPHDATVADGHPRTACLRLVESEQYRQALQPCTRAAERGFASAQAYLGWMYLNANGVRQNYAEAFRWNQRAANQGNALAQNDLGFMYDDGKGVQENNTQAVYWYRKSAKQGFATAQANLGWMYDNGEGVAENNFTAVRWYRKSAEQENAWGQYLLGTMYEHGEGVQESVAVAVHWYRKAAAQDEDNAKKRLEELGE